MYTIEFVFSFDMGDNWRFRVINNKSLDEGSKMEHVEISSTNDYHYVYSCKTMHSAETTLRIILNNIIMPASDLGYLASFTIDMIGQLRNVREQKHRFYYGIIQDYGAIYVSYVEKEENV